MKLAKTVTGLAFAVALMVGASTVLAGQSCCVKAKAAGKDCSHQCCIDAHKEKKTCEKCQKEASCCDKAIAQARNVPISAAKILPRNTRFVTSATSPKK